MARKISIVLAVVLAICAGSSNLSNAQMRGGVGGVWHGGGFHGSGFHGGFHGGFNRGFGFRGGWWGPGWGWIWR
jgi:hypothetical protein